MVCFVVIYFDQRLILFHYLRYTNPDKDASLETCDSVFILAQDPPDDLLAPKPAFSDVVESLGKARRLSMALQV